MERRQIPEGFEQLLHDLTKEILREQPKDINKYCLNYFLAKKNGTPLPVVEERNDFGIQRQNEIEQQKENKVTSQVEVINDAETGLKHASIQSGDGFYKNEIQKKQISRESNGTIKEIANEYVNDSQNLVLDEFKNI